MWQAQPQTCGASFGKRPQNWVTNRISASSHICFFAIGQRKLPNVFFKDLVKTDCSIPRSSRSSSSAARGLARSPRSPPSRPRLTVPGLGPRLSDPRSSQDFLVVSSLKLSQVPCQPASGLPMSSQILPSPSGSPQVVPNCLTSPQVPRSSRVAPGGPFRPSRGRAGRPVFLDRPSSPRAAPGPKPSLPSRSAGRPRPRVGPGWSRSARAGPGPGPGGHCLPRGQGHLMRRLGSPGRDPLSPQMSFEQTLD